MNYKYVDPNEPNPDTRGFLPACRQCEFLDNDLERGGQLCCKYRNDRDTDPKFPNVEPCNLYENFYVNMIRNTFSQMQEHILDLEEAKKATGEFLSEAFTS